MPDINKLITDWGYAGISLVVILGNIGVGEAVKTSRGLSSVLGTWYRPICTSRRFFG